MGEGGDRCQCNDAVSPKICGAQKPGGSLLLLPYLKRSLRCNKQIRFIVGRSDSGGKNMKKRTCSAPVQETRFFSKTNEFFEVYLARQVLASIHTIRSYRAGLSVFFDYVTTVKGFTPKNFLFSDCTFNLVLGFLQTMKETLHY